QRAGLERGHHLLGGVAVGAREGGVHADAPLVGGVELGDHLLEGRALVAADGVPEVDRGLGARGGRQAQGRGGERAPYEVLRLHVSLSSTLIPRVGRGRGDRSCDALSASVLRTQKDSRRWWPPPSRLGRARAGLIPCSPSWRCPR